MDIDAALFALAVTQHNHMATAQLRSLGISRWAVRHRLERGRLERVTDRVLRLAGAAPAVGERPMAAVLDAGEGSVLSHTAAAAWWGVPGFTLAALHVSRIDKGPNRPSMLATLHTLRALPGGWTTVHDGIPIVRPELCAYQLCGVLRPERAERAMDQFWSLGLCSGRSMRALLAELAEHGRNGTVVFRELLAARPDDYVPHQSGVETRFTQVLREAGEPIMRRQVDTGDGEKWIGRVDFRDEHLPLIVEILSERYHTSLVDAAADGARITALEAAGFTVLPIWDTEVWTSPAAVVTKVRDARGRLTRSVRQTVRPGAPFG